MPIQICLKCARQEHRDRLHCECGGTLWYPQNVGGKAGNNGDKALDEAARLIKAGKKPWQKP